MNRGILITRNQVGTMKRLTILLVFLFVPAMAHTAQSIDQLWDSAEPPPAPVLQPVTINPATTALLVLDIEELTCNAERRPRCLDTVPRIASLLEKARKAGMAVIHSLTPKKTPFLKPVTPIRGEPVVSASVDKFYKTDMDKILEARGIKSVIVTGTAAHGAVLHTATAAGFRGYHVILPVDCLSASTLYIEQASVWLLKTGPGTRRNITLTRSELMKFK